MSHRSHFADFEGIAYFDGASQGPLPQRAAAAAAAAIDEKTHPYRVTDATYFERVGEVRRLAGKLLGCAPARLAVTTGASGGINTVARGLGLGAGDEIVVAAREFPANYFPWLRLAERGVSIVEVPPDDASGAVSAAAIAARIGPRTRVVAFAHVSYLHGGRLDPAPIVERARAAGAYVVVDGSQAAGALAFDFDAASIDAYSTCGYKHLLGPYGSGVALYSARLLERLEVGDINWWSVAGAEDFNRLPGAGFRLKDDASRFDAHEPASFINSAAFAASLSLLDEISPAAVEAHTRRVTDRILAGLPPRWRAGSPLGASQRSHIVCLEAETPAATKAAFERLRAARVWLSLRGDRLRVATHVYNDDDDVDRLLASI